MNFRECYFHDLPDALVKEHYDEISTLDAGAGLDVDMDMYDLIDLAGRARCYCAETDSGETVGYAGFVVSRMPLYKSLMRASNHVLFLGAKYRKGADGYNFLKYCDAELRKDPEVRVIQWGVTARRDFSVLLRRLGYTAIETTYAKQVGTADV